MKLINIKLKWLVLLGFMLTSGNLLAGDFPEKGDMVRGAKAWSENCMRCHNLRNAGELRDDQWITTVFHMRVRGGLTGQETRDILTFLQNTN
ncbi:MAG: cytochrome c [Gammaproteobacteria bacterium]|nr:cytochrome c [Gammaproteobacteria bacterium]